MSRHGRMEPTERAEGIDIVASVFMASGMIAVATLSGSVSVLAEGIDTVVDIVASAAVLIGLKLSRRHTKDFPDGLYKLENVVAVAIGTLILFSAYELAQEAIERLTGDPTPISSPGVAMATMAVVVAITGWLAWYKGRVGRAENSPSLSADSRHSWTDALASAGVILGVGLNAVGVPDADAIMALVIVVILAWSGGQVVLDAVRVLLDASIEPDVLAAATKAAAADPRVRRVVRVDGRNSGSYRFLHVAVVPAALDLEDAEAAADAIRRSVKAAVQNVESVQVEFAHDEDPELVVAVPLTAEANAITGDLAAAHSAALLGVDPASGVVDRTTTLDSPLAPDDPGRAIALAVLMARRGANLLLVNESRPTGGVSYVLSANAIDVVLRSDVATLVDARRAAPSLIGSGPALP
jgi:cation diffusion facilitator family transporter